MIPKKYLNGKHCRNMNVYVNIKYLLKNYEVFYGQGKSEFNKSYYRHSE